MHFTFTTRSKIDDRVLSHFPAVNYLLLVDNNWENTTDNQYKSIVYAAVLYPLYVAFYPLLFVLWRVIFYFINVIVSSSIYT